jgi:hypothetical protein
MMLWLLSVATGAGVALTLQVIASEVFLLLIRPVEIRKPT